MFLIITISPSIFNTITGIITLSPFHLIKSLTTLSNFVMNMNVVSRRQFLESKVATGRAIMSITQSMLENWFTYHSPTADDQVGYVAIRVAAKTLAETIVKYSPPSADQSAAIRLLREAVMTANASIACKGQ